MAYTKEAMILVLGVLSVLLLLGLQMQAREHEIVEYQQRVEIRKLSDIVNQQEQVIKVLTDQLEDYKSNGIAVGED